MSFYEDNIVPYLIELGCGMKELAEPRVKTAAALHGTVLEIGFGSGLNLPYLPASVTKLLAVDPSQRGRALAKKRLAAARCEVEFVGLDAQAIQVDSSFADGALCT